MMFADRTMWSSETNPLIVLFEKLKSQKTKIFDLTVSNPTQCGFQYPSQEILQGLLHSENVVYRPESFGNFHARQAIAQEYLKQDIALKPENIIFTASSSESYSFLFRLLLNPGDHVLLPKPSYPLLELLSQINDVFIDRYSLMYDHAWRIDFKSLEKVIGPKTKVIVLVHPNNPTGSYVTMEERNIINVICQKYHLALICDEVFWEYCLEDDGPSSLAANQAVFTCTLGGLSKSLALPQMKLSWITLSGPRQSAQEAAKKLEIIADTYLSVNTPCQNALQEWLSLKPFIQDQIKRRIFQNYQKIFGFLKHETKISAYRIEGGWYLVMHLCEKICEEDFVLWLLEKEHVFVHPGYFFDFHEGVHIIVSLLTPEEILEEGISRLLKCFHSKSLPKDNS